MRLAFLLASLLVVFGSCTDDNPVLFTFPVEERFILPAGLNIFTRHVFIERDVIGRYQEALSSSQFSDADVIEIQPGRARLVGVRGDEFFGNIDEVIISVIDRNNPDSKREIFFREDVRLNEEGTLDLFGSLSEVKDWVSGERFDLEIVFIFRQVTSVTQELLIDLEFVAKGD